MLKLVRVTPTERVSRKFLFIRFHRKVESADNPSCVAVRIKQYISMEPNEQEIL